MVKPSMPFTDKQQQMDALLIRHQMHLGLVAHALTTGLLPRQRESSPLHIPWVILCASCFNDTGSSISSWKYTHGTHTRDALSLSSEVY